jgi:outer membrane receptor protein involved in Fe transport
VELTAGKTLAGGTFLQVAYTSLDVQAAGVTQLSKYVLDYAPHNTAVSAGARAPLGLDLSMRLGWTERYDGRSYQVVDVHAARAYRRLTVFVDAANLFDERYQEIPGVAMPGRWMSAGVRVDVRGRSAKIASGDTQNALSGIVHRPDATGADAPGRQGTEDRR